MNILNSANTAATINKIIHNAQGTTKTSEGATAAGKIIKENLPDIISAGFDMPHPTSIFEGVPPFSFISNGDPLVNWIIYGNTGGVGDKTANLININYSEAGGISDTGEVITNPNAWRSTIYYDIDATLNYVASKASQTIRINYYDESKNHISRESITQDSYKQLTIPNNAKYFKWTLYSNKGISDIQAAKELKPMINTGTTVKPYEPFGYKIPVICGGVTTNIYIDEPLTSGETISYNDTGVIIPSSMFLNTLSVDTTVQPEKVFIEYVK